ncbi:MAG: cell division protein ZapA [Eubacteriales bacterium]|jgi:cell division protein ZapA (FtsZ GTPase activity inhibitor)|nr:cell division protein ZapA [Clostridiales bacterium]
MKQRYTVEVAGTILNLLSDESEEYVMGLAKIVSRKINDIVVSNKRCTKFDAAILACLDYLDDKMKTAVRVDDLQSQIMSYAQEAAKLRRENAELRRKLGLPVEQSEDEE